MSRNLRVVGERPRSCPVDATCALSDRSLWPDTARTHHVGGNRSLADRDLESLMGKKPQNGRMVMADLSNNSVRSRVKFGEPVPAQEPGRASASYLPDPSFDAISSRYWECGGEEP